MHLPYPSASPGGQLMLDGRAPYADGAVDGSPTVSLHSRPHMSAPSGADHQGSSCAPGQCSTPDTCNPPAPAPYQQQQQQQAQYSYDPHAQGRRPDFARKVSASSGSHLTAASDSPDYTSAGGGSYGTQGATPASSIMQSPPIEPVHLQRPVFGQPSPGQSYQNDLSLPSPSALFSVSSYDNEQDGHRLSQYPPPTPAYPYQQQQPSSSSQQQQNQQQQRLPIYGSYGTCDVEDLLGASAYEPFDERKPDLRRAVSDPSAAPPAMLAPPLPAPPALSQSASADAVPTAGGSAAAAASGEQTAFISKLWHLLTHAEYERYLRWNTAGDAFILTNANEFAIRVLPRFFRHSNVASFIRQLNLYSFSRVSTIRLLVRAPRCPSCTQAPNADLSLVFRSQDMADASTSTAIIPHSQPADLDGTAPDHAHHHHGDSDSDAGSAHSGEGGQAQASPVDASIAASGACPAFSSVVLRRLNVTRCRPPRPALRLQASRTPTSSAADRTS